MRITTMIIREGLVVRLPFGISDRCQTVKRVESESHVWSLPIFTCIRRIRTGS